MVKKWLSKGKDYSRQARLMAVAPAKTSVQVQQEAGTIIHQLSRLSWEITGRESNSLYLLIWLENILFRSKQRTADGESG